MTQGISSIQTCVMNLVTWRRVAFLFSSIGRGVGISIFLLVDFQTARVFAFFSGSSIFWLHLFMECCYEKKATSEKGQRKKRLLSLSQGSTAVQRRNSMLSFFSDNQVFLCSTVVGYTGFNGVCLL